MTAGPGVGTSRILGALLAGLLSILCVPAAYASFPGENGKIAFGYCGSVDCGIFVMEPDGSGRTQITHNPYVRSDRFGTSPMRDRAPAWSPRGDRIAFVRAVPQGNPEIVVANADGSDPRSLGEGNDPAWSPSGTRIAFWRFGGPLGSGGIFVINADGSGVTRILQGQNARGPDWSPDGTRIAYSDSPPGGSQDPEIWVVPAAGGTPTSLTPPDSSQGSASPRAFNFGPSWSPDAARVAFASSVPGYQWDVFTIAADGTGRARVTFTDAGFSPESEEEVSWSPDGTRIAYERTGGTAPSGIVVTGADGAGDTFLGPGDETAWQPLPVNHAPDCGNVAASPGKLWPPNGHLRRVTLSGATDPDGDPFTLAIEGITQDEPVGAAADAAGRDAEQLMLRAERAVGGDGRVYRVAFTVSDGTGGECSGAVSVEVRRHTSRTAVDSAPPSYDSVTGQPGS